VKIKIAQTSKFDKKQIFDFKLAKVMQNNAEAIQIRHCYVITQHITIPNKEGEKFGIMV